MDARKTAKRARTVAVMVRVRGPDPKGLKMRGHAFHLRENGITSISASGFLLPALLEDSLPKIGGHEGNGAIIVTSASVVESFLHGKYRSPASNDNSSYQKVVPELIPGTTIDVRLDQCVFDQKLDLGSPSWHPAKLLSIVDVAASSDALKLLVKSNNSSTDSGSWDLGWILAPANNNDSNPSLSIYMQKEIPSSVKVAFLRIPGIECKDHLPLKVSMEQRKGDFLLAVGSPFGILSPSNFLNSVTVGAISNVFPRNSSGSLLVADMRCLPGMEGGPVFDQNESFVGIISQPIRQKNTNVEIQIIIMWDSICASLWELERARLSKGVDQKIKIKSTASSNSPVEKAASSVVLITIGNESWASGIVINDRGLILTNAHLLEPWRFRRHEELGFSSSEPQSRQLEKEASPQSPPKDPNLAKNVDLKTLSYKWYKRILVRLNHEEPFIWSDARVVYVSKGPLDIALLQLDFVPQKLDLIVPDFMCPPEGSRVHAVGHGPFGPSSEIHPFVSSGVVTKVVKSKFPRMESSTSHEPSVLPVMLQTTASVFPGMSGGAIVNATNGRMVALITSNVRHAGGSTIPYLNFSLPCAALKPVFDFAESMTDEHVLVVLDKPDVLLSSIWALAPPPQPNEDLKGKGEKGSRFAKFLADRGEKDAASNELKPLSRRKVSSRL